MKFISFLFLYLFVGMAAANPYTVKVLRVIDGDTIEIEAAYLPPELHQKLGIRVLGIDTPEKAPRARCLEENMLAQQASEYTKTLVSKAKHVEVDFTGWDKYGGRVLGNVRIDGQDLAEQLLLKGLARPYFGGKKNSWCE